MYRPEIKVLDCTIRDGGLINKWQFSDDFVSNVFHALNESGIDYMEIGYKSSKDAFARPENGKWKFTEEDDLRKLIDGTDLKMQMGALCDIGRIEKNDIAPKSESILDLMRVACYAKTVDKGIDLCNHCLDKGYQSALQMMAVSQTLDRDLDEALEDIAKTEIPVVYIVDSFGALYSEQVHDLVKKFSDALPGRTIGFHGHNNQQLGFANTIAAIIAGANRLDATLYGIGRAAGNCQLELLLSFLKNPKYKLRPIIKVIQDEMIPLTKEVEWGYNIPYMLTGTLNEHPRDAIALRESDNPDMYMEFYDLLKKPV